MATNLFDAKVKAPKGDDFSMLPQPIQQAIARAKIVQGGAVKNQSGMDDIATVDEGSRDTITVRDQAKFAQGRGQVMSHEATHFWQNSLPQSIRSQFAPNPKSGSPYYDPASMLQTLATQRAQGTKLENLSDEHQAQIMQAYYMYHGDAEYKKGLQPWVDDVVRIQNQADLENLLHKPVLPDSKNLMALYNGQRGN